MAFVTTVQEPDGAGAKIAVRGLNVSYRTERGDTKQALATVDIDVHAREVLALIGPSGCGKTTFLRVLNRMNDTVAGISVTGSVLFDGVDIYGPKVDPVTVRRRVGMVFQRAQLFPMTVWDNVAYGLRAHGVRRHEELAPRVEGALVRTGLWAEVKDRLDAPGEVLSAGQAQRLSVARALAVEPEVLLMDEPTSALDPIATAKIEELVQELRSSLTVVVVTHSMQQAARISQRTAFFHLGQLVEVGPTSRMFTRPTVARTEEYISGRFG